MSYEFKGLPGPYRKDEAPNGWYIEQYTEDDVLPYCLTFVPHNAGTKGQAEALADLFAAAPDLLQVSINALYDMYNLVPESPARNSRIEQIKQAIEKALNIKTSQP